MFDNSKEQLQTQGTGNYKQYIGLYPMQIVAINPSVEKLTALIGEGASKFKLDYSVGQYGKPVTFWFKSPDNKVQPFSRTIFLNKENIQSENSGKSMILNNSTGQYGTVQSTWSDGPDNVPAWFSKDGLRAAQKGEYDYYDLLVKFLRFRDKSDGSGVSYVEFFKAEGLDFDSVYDGDDSALNQLAEYLTDNGNAAVMLLTVKEGDGGKAYQGVEFGDMVFGQNSVTEKLKERVAKKNTPDYPVSKDVWSIDFTEYVPGQSGAPAETVTKKEPTKKASWI